MKTVVHDVSLTVRRGEVHGLIGESGSGKTQTAFSVMRLLPPRRPDHRRHGQSSRASSSRRPEKEMTRLRGAKIAYIPQEPMSNLDPAFTIGSQLTEPMRVCARDRQGRGQAAGARPAGPRGHPQPERTFAAYPHQISGGMAQRVLIAGAVSCNPDLLIADEPTTALDVTVQAEVLDLLRDLQEEFHMGVLLVTHNFGVVADLCDRVSVMRNGRIVETGPARAIFASPRTSTPGRCSTRSSRTPSPRPRGAPAYTPGPTRCSMPAPIEGATTMNDRLLDVDQLVVEYPGRASGQAVPGAARGLAGHPSASRPSAWSASRARARPRSAAPCSAWHPSRAGPSGSRAATSATSPALSGGRCPATSAWSSRIPTRP